VESRPLTTALVGTLAVVAAVLALGMLPFAGVPIPQVDRHPDAAALEDSAWPFGIARWEALRALAVAAGIGVASAIGWLPFAGIALAVVPSIAIRIRAQVARDRARSATTQVLLTTHAMLRSGVALPEALRRAAAGCPDQIARRPFERAIERFDLGDPLDAAIRGAVVSSADRRLVAMFHTLALGVTERLPIERAASLVGAMAERAVHDDRLDAEVRARSAGVRLQSSLLAAIVPALALYLVATMPGLGETLASTLGRTVLLPLAAFLEIAGILIGRRIVGGVSR
jgi:Flp pilus assembly protein TadB